MPEEIKAAKPKKRRPRRPLKQATIRYLSKHLADAHVRWAHMTTADRQRVMEAIRGRYGWGFAVDFKKIADRGSYSRPAHITGEYRYSRQQLDRKGYTFVKEIAPGYEEWLHPNGRYMYAFVNKSKDTNQKITEPVPKAPGGTVKDIPDQLPSTETLEDSITAYGDLVAEKEMDIFGGNSLVSVYDDGTIEVINEETGKRMTMRVLPGSGGDGNPYYMFYDDDGKSMNSLMPFDVSQILE